MIEKAIEKIKAEMEKKNISHKWRGEDIRNSCRRIKAC